MWSHIYKLRLLQAKLQCSYHPTNLLLPRGIYSYGKDHRLKSRSSFPLLQFMTQSIIVKLSLCNHYSKTISKLNCELEWQTQGVLFANPSFYNSWED